MSRDDVCEMCNGHGEYDVPVYAYAGAVNPRRACGECNGTGRIQPRQPSATPADDPWTQAPLPALPYAGTSGWSGTQTSFQRAVAQDNEGTTTERQGAALAALEWAGADGLTWRELAARLYLHHGSASGVLSVLHKEGMVARLTETRQRCKVYVLPKHVRGRETEGHGRKAVAQSCPNCGCSLGGAA